MRAVRQSCLSLQRLNLVAFCLGVRGLVSPPISQTLALDAFGGNLGALHVGDFASVTAEVELTNLALEMCRADVIVGADDAAFGDREVTSTLFVCQKPPRTYLSIEWFTQPWPANPLPTFG